MYALVGSAIHNQGVYAVGECFVIVFRAINRGGEIQLSGSIDPTGAGDSATAAAVLALCAGAELPEAALVGNLVASITVQQIGTTGVARPDQLPPRLDLWRQQQTPLR